MTPLCINQLVELALSLFFGLNWLLRETREGDISTKLFPFYVKARQAKTIIMTYVGLTLPTSTLCNFACTRLQTHTSLDYLFIHFLIINFPATTTTTTQRNKVRNFMHY